MHLCLQGVALASGVFGIWTKFHSKDGVVANFYSLHSWMGLICVCLFGAQVLLFVPLIPCLLLISFSLNPINILLNGIYKTFYFVEKLIINGFLYAMGNGNDVLLQCTLWSFRYSVCKFKLRSDVNYIIV